MQNPTIKQFGVLGILGWRSRLLTNYKLKILKNHVIKKFLLKNIIKIELTTFNIMFFNLYF